MTQGGTAKKLDEAMTTWPTTLNPPPHRLFGIQHGRDVMVYSGQG